MPSVSRGTVYRRPETKNWFIKFQVDGKSQRESAGTDDREQALAHLQRRVEEAKRGVFVGLRDRITFEDMHRLLMGDYQFRQNRTNPDRFVKHLAESFGGMRGEDITEARIKEHCRKRLDRDGMAPASLRRELAVLSRMLHLAAPHLPRIPVVEFPRVDNARQGFVEEQQLQAVLPHLPIHARYLVEFLYLTGWRSSEAFGLLWCDVDWKRETIRLRTSKNREPRIFAFKYHPRLESVLRSQREEVARWESEHSQICPTVFHWRGRPIRKLRRSWQGACRSAGVAGLLLHDFRRSAVRNLIRAGVEQPIAMKITGHRSGVGFRRYLIVDDEMLAQAVGKVATYLQRERDTMEGEPV